MTPLDQLDPLPPLGQPVPPPAVPPVDQWVQVPGEPIGIQCNITTGKHRNVDPRPMAAWPFGA